jgi:large subunit ribosomal protein L6e
VLRRQAGLNLEDHTDLSLQKKQIASARATDQKAIDKALLSNIKNEPDLLEYLRSTFSLRRGDRPHEMKW